MRENGKNKSELLTDFINEALGSEPPVNIPENFTDRIMRRIERKVLWADILKEFGLKIALISGVLLIASAIFLLINYSEIRNFSNIIDKNRQPFLHLLILVFFAYFMNEVLLKVLMHRKSFGFRNK